MNGLLEDDSQEGYLWFDPDQPFSEISFMVPLEPRGEEIPLDKIQISLMPMSISQDQTAPLVPGQGNIGMFSRSIEECDMASYVSDQTMTSMAGSEANLAQHSTIPASSRTSMSSISQIMPLKAPQPDTISITSKTSSQLSDSEKSYPYLLGEITRTVITVMNDVQWACVNFSETTICINQEDKMLKIPVQRRDRLNNKVRVHWSIPEMLASDKIYSSMKGILTIPSDALEAEIPIEMFPRPLDSEVSKFTIVLGPGISDEACLGGETRCEVEINNNIGKYLLPWTNLIIKRETPSVTKIR